MILKIICYEKKLILLLAIGLGFTVKCTLSIPQVSFKYPFSGGVNFKKQKIGELMFQQLPFCFT